MGGRRDSVRVSLTSGTRTSSPFLTQGTHNEEVPTPRCPKVALSVPQPLPSRPSSLLPSSSSYTVGCLLPQAPEQPARAMMVDKYCRIHCPLVATCGRSRLQLRARVLLHPV